MVLESILALAGSSPQLSCSFAKAGLWRGSLLQSLAGSSYSSMPCRVCRLR